MKALIHEPEVFGGADRSRIDVQTQRDQGRGRVVARQLGDGQVDHSYKSILFEVMDEAADSERSASGRIDARGLFYACRRLYLNHPRRSLEYEASLAANKKNPEHILEYDYFNTTILPEYERKYGEINGLVRDSRGHLHEPHRDRDDGAGTEIGTEFVAEFDAPDYYYDKVLYVEKHGIAQGFIDEGLGKRYDMAIVASKGYATEADRRLLQAFDDEGYQVFVLHDCDIDGYGIVSTVSEGNERMPDLDIEVIDLGLSLADAQELGMLGEPTTRQKAIPEPTKALLTGEELALFTGTRRNKKVWDIYRYELNEVPSAERLPFVERKLQENGVHPKVLPPDDYLGNYAANRRDHDLGTEVNMAIDEIVGREAIVEALLEQFRDRYDLEGMREHIIDVFERRPRTSWRAVLDQRIGGMGSALHEEIEDAVREEIEERISEGEEESPEG